MVFKNREIGNLIEASMGSNIIYLGYGITLFFYLFFTYLTFYYIVDRSVSSKIMIELEKAPKKEMDFSELIKTYSLEKKYTDQINGMLEGGFIVEVDKRYRCTTKGLLVATIARFFKEMLRLGRGG